MASPRKIYSQPQPGSEGFARTKKVLGPGSTANILTTDNVTGNNLAVAYVPAGFVLTAINVNVPILDSGAALVWNLGDAALANRLVSGSIIGRGSAGSVTALAATGQYYKFPAPTEIWLNIGTQAATPVAGALTNFYLEGFMQDS